MGFPIAPFILFIVFFAAFIVFRTLHRGECERLGQYLELWGEVCFPSSRQCRPKMANL